MRILMLLCCVWFTSAGTVPEKCDQVIFDGKYYDRELLLADVFALNLSYVKSTNTILFNNFVEGFNYYNMDTKELMSLYESTGNRTTLINTDTDEVYLGCYNGIYKLNPQTKVKQLYTAEGRYIARMYFFNKTLFYTTLKNLESYSFDGKETIKLPDTAVHSVTGLIGDKEYYIYNRTGLYYGVLNGKEETVVRFSLEETFYDIVFARDNNKKIFVVRLSGVYTPNVQEKKLDKVSDIGQVDGLAFDKDNNIIYSDFNNIYKLTLSQAKCPPA